MRGPPWAPGNTAESSTFAWAALQRTRPPRGPRSVLCVVVVTKSAWGMGEGWSPQTTRPAMCAMSAKRSAPEARAISPMRAKSITLEYALDPTVIIFGFSAMATAASWS